MKKTKIYTTTFNYDMGDVTKFYHIDTIDFKHLNNAEQKKFKYFYENIYSMKNFEECYKQPSHAKKYIYNKIVDNMIKIFNYCGNSIIDFEIRVSSYNTMIFTIVILIKTPRNVYIKYITPSNDLLVKMD